ncbi:repressor LexA [Candidatus Falkowbacteria bacterium]|nr:repressor LexA [Candidatus Falkowbacteria bacterium]
MKKGVKNNSITKRQKDLLFLIYNYIKDTGYPPTFEEMRHGLGVSSNQSVLDHLIKLGDNKLIKRNESVARSIAILPLGYEALDEPHLAPFIGAASAGAPVEAIEITGEWQTVSPEVARLEEEVFLLKITGDSMINAGIDDGDTVLVQSKEEFLTREIVLAQIGSEATVKRFMSEDEPPYVYLKPENPKYKIILFTDEVELKGKVISVLKSGFWKPIK